MYGGPVINYASLKAFPIQWIAVVTMFIPIFTRADHSNHQRGRKGLVSSSTTINVCNAANRSKALPLGGVVVSEEDLLVIALV